MVEAIKKIENDSKSFDANLQRLMNEINELKDKDKGNDKIEWIFDDGETALNEWLMEALNKVDTKIIQKLLDKVNLFYQDSTLQVDSEVKGNLHKLWDILLWILKQKSLNNIEWWNIKQLNEKETWNGSRKFQGDTFVWHWENWWINWIWKANYSNWDTYEWGLEWWDIQTSWKRSYFKKNWMPYVWRQWDWIMNYKNWWVYTWKFNWNYFAEWIFKFKGVSIKIEWDKINSWKWSYLELDGIEQDAITQLRNLSGYLKNAQNVNIDTEDFFSNTILVNKKDWTQEKFDIDKEGWSQFVVDWNDMVKWMNDYIESS